MALVFAMLGLVAGSFINVCIDRLPRGHSIVFPPSHCAACNHVLRVTDLVPVFSYLWLRGRCRYCQAPIPLRVPLVEGATALLFALLYWKLDPGFELVLLLFYAGLLTIIFVIDLEHQLILNKIIYPAMALIFILSFFPLGIPAVETPGGDAISQWVTPLAGQAVARAAVALAGGLIGLLAMSLPILIYPGGMGWGDIKLAALVGLMTGFPLVILTLLLSWIGGGIVAALLLASKIKGRKDPIPSGTFLAVSAMVTLLWGREFLEWYL